MNRLLYRHFLASFFVSDLLAAGGDLRTLFTLIGALCAVPGLLLAFYAAPHAGGFDMTPIAAVFLTLSMVLMGLVTVLAWDRLFPDRIDYMVLRPLPLPARDVFFAKLGALGAFLCIFAALINAFSSTLVPLFGSSQHGGLFHGLRLMGAEAAAAGASAAWMFAALLALQGALLAVGGPRLMRRAGPAVQLALMTLLLTALVLLPNLFDLTLMARLETARYARWLPTLWFIGIDKVLAGTAGGFWTPFGALGASVLGLTVAAALFFYALGYRRLWTAAEDASGEVRRRQPRWVAFLCRAPRERAVARFAVLTLARSPRHRLFLSLWMGLGAAMVFETVIELAAQRNSTLADVERAALAVPLVLTFVLMLGLRHVFAVPAGTPANWIFRLSDTPFHTERFRAAGKLLLIYAAVPAVLLSLPLTVWIFDWHHALVHAVLAALLSALLAQILVARSPKLPFTCSYLPGVGNIAKLMRLSLGVFGFTLYAYTTVALELRFWQHPLDMAEALVALGAAVAALALVRHRWYAGGVRCLLDDEPEPFVTPLFSRD